MLPLRVCLEIQGSALGGTEQKKPAQLEQTTHHSVLLTLLCHGRVRNCSSCMNFTRIQITFSMAATTERVRMGAAQSCCQWHKESPT